ncbi:MAG: transcriptional regulator, partial [Marivivens sp.]|nr:transcriptional regulator [Marivivens sp.]
MANNLPTLAPANMTEAIEFSKMLAQSEMVPKNYQRKPQDVLV